MLLNSLKDLDRLMILCKKRGVKSIKIDGIEFVMSDDVEYDTSKRGDIASNLPDIPGSLEQDSKIVSDFPTEEQLMFGSADPSVWQNLQAQEKVYKDHIEKQRKSR